ncbi:MAG: DUF4296 domain-containing protein [Bacteroidetes bacterium]|nr:DUF4296 domain-containing protein [Bacteroidota bacterium]
MNYEFKKVSSFIVLCTLYIVFGLSCGQSEKQVVIPANVLPKEKMAEVITDIHLAEAETNFRPLPDSASTEKLSFQKVFEENKITKAQYDTSISFYIGHPELLNEVYEKVLNELSKMQAGKK